MEPSLYIRNGPTFLNQYEQEEKIVELAGNACQKSWNTDINFQGQNQSSPSPPRNNVGLLSNGLGF